MHGLSTAAVGLLDRQLGASPWQWVRAGLLLSILGLPLTGLALSGFGAATLGPSLAASVCAIGLSLQGACLGCVVTMVQPLLAALAAQRGDLSVAPLLAVSDSGQSLGFTVGPILGSLCVRHTEWLSIGLAAAAGAALIPVLLHLAQK